MVGVRRGARSVMKWLSALYVLLIIVQVFLAGAGIFGINSITNSDDCDKKGVDAAHLPQCYGNSKTLDPHRGLGFFLTGPGAILFFIVALLAWHPTTRTRIVSIALPFLLVIQMILPGFNRWIAALHPVNAMLLLGLFIWLTYTLRREQPAAPSAPEPIATG